MEEVTIESLAALIAEQNKKIDQQAAIIGKLSKKEAQPAEAKKLPEVPKEEVEVGGKKYKFLVASFRLAGDSTVYTAEEALLDEALLEQIITIEGQGMLKEVL